MFLSTGRDNLALYAFERGVLKFFKELRCVINKLFY